ncbi:MAG: hypothetical protein QNJ13_12855 [Paracoccaceae bacterium]|nr:hypothetical protein [Paracoccaceae bacterium]
MVTANQQQQVFQDRINRIREKQGQPPLADPALAAPAVMERDGPLVPRSSRSTAPKKEVSPVPSLRENLAYPMSLVGAFFVGMLAVFAARYARFHIAGGSMVGEDADIAMMMDGALAMGVGFVFRSFFRFETKDYITAKTVGIAAMIALMHNLVHWAPGVFAGLFDEEYVEMTLELTEPNSILFRGMSFVINEPQTAQSSAMPTFIELDGR